MTLAQILKYKGSTILSVAPATPMTEVVKILAEKRIGAVLVCDNDRLTGILSERDIVRTLADHAGGTLDMTAEQ